MAHPLRPATIPLPAVRRLALLLWTACGAVCLCLPPALLAGPGIPDPAQGGWQLNGSAAVVGPPGQLQLTDAATQYAAGSAFWPVAVSSSSLSIAFDLFMGGGSGADGVALVFADPSAGATATSLGGAGAGLGLKGIPGWGVGFESYPSSFVGLAQGGTDIANYLSYATQAPLPDLRDAAHHVVVQVALGNLTVTLDGVQVLAAAVPLPANVLLGFSGANGGLTDQHAVSNVAILTPGLLTASASSLAFGTVTIGKTGAQPLTLTNSGGEIVTVSGVTAPASPFAATGLPAPGATIAPGASLDAQVSFTPAASGLQSGTLAVSSDGGSVSVDLSGTGATPGVLTITPASLDFGTVGSDGSVGRSFVVSNTGESVLTITSSQPPALGQFFATTPLPAGTSIAPGASRTLWVRLTPTALGALSDGWLLNGDGLGGPQTVPLTGAGGSATGSGVADPGLGGWQLNGTAGLAPVSATEQLQLTDPTNPYETGSAFWPIAIPSGSLRVTFDLFMGGGSGADGLALVFADPSAGATPYSLGGAGAGLGVKGVPGWAVGFENYPSSFVGVGQGGTQIANYMSYAFEAPLPDLRNSLHHVVVQAADGNLTVGLDGVQVLAGAVTLPANVLLGFSGANGGLTDLQRVSNVAVSPAATLAVGDPEPARLALRGAYPNPGRESHLEVAFSLASHERATLELFDPGGRRVVAREVGGLGPGPHVVNLAEGRTLAAGFYALRLRQGRSAITRKALVVE